jgi:hypothetical protein
MDIVIGVLSFALVIGVSAMVGRSLDRARLRAQDDPKDAEPDLYGDF